MKRTKLLIEVDYIFSLLFHSRRMTGRDYYKSIVWQTDPKTQDDLSVCPDYSIGFAVWHNL